MALGAMGVVKRGGFGGMGGGRSGGVVPGPFLLLVDGTSVLLLANGTDKLLITGVAPASGGVSGSPIGILVSITYP